MFTNNSRLQVFTNYDLPFDVLDLIFRFLPLKDSVRCLLVSRAWFYFIMDLYHFSKELPSLANNKGATMKLLQQILSSKSCFVIQGSTSSITKSIEQNSTVTTNEANNFTHVDTVKLLTYILNDTNNQIKSLFVPVKNVGFKNWIRHDNCFRASRSAISTLLSHGSISTYSLEWTNLKSCIGWDRWTFPHYYYYPRLECIKVSGNRELRHHYKETGWYRITGSFPVTLPKHVPNHCRAMMRSTHLGKLEYFKLSIPATSLSQSRLYPDCGAFRKLPSLVHLYLDVFNPMDSLLCARIASGHSPELQNIVISPLAEMPKDVRYSSDMSDKAPISSSSSSSSAAAAAADGSDDNKNNNGLQCFVWTLGNARPEDPKHFEWLCPVNTCPCYRKNVSRIIAKHYQHLKLLYLQFDGQHGIAFRTIRFLSNIEDCAKNVRELHLHATSSTLFGQFQCTDKEKQRYGSADNISQYLAQAIEHLPALEIIVLENEDCSSLILTEQEASSIVYMTIYDDVLRSLAINCTRLKEVVIWGPHMHMTASGVTEFIINTVSNQSLEIVEIDCSLTDGEIDILLHRGSLMTKLKSLKVKDRSNLLYSF